MMKPSSVFTDEALKTSLDVNTCCFILHLTFSNSPSMTSEMTSLTLWPLTLFTNLVITVNHQEARWQVRMSEKTRIFFEGVFLMGWEKQESSAEKQIKPADRNHLKTLQFINIHSLWAFIFKKSVQTWLKTIKLDWMMLKTHTHPFYSR